MKTERSPWDRPTADLRSRCVRLWAFMAFTLVAGPTLLSGAHLEAQPLGTDIRNDPAKMTFGMTNPVTSSLQATENFANRLLEQQHRFQANSDRRQLRPKRPEPGEVEVTREEETTILSDPLRSTLKEILPRER